MKYIKTYKFENLPVTKDGEPDISSYVEIMVYEKKSLTLENDQLIGKVVDSFYVKKNEYFSNTELFGVEIDTDDVDHIVPNETVGIFQKANSLKSKGVGFFKLSANEYLIKYYQNTPDGTILSDASTRTKQRISNKKLYSDIQKYILGNLTKLYKKGTYLKTTRPFDVTKKLTPKNSIGLFTDADYADEDKLKKFIEKLKELERTDRK